MDNQIEHIRTRVDKIEEDHHEIVQVVRDFQKDFHILTSNLSEVKEVLKTISTTSTDIALFRQRYEAYIEMEAERTKRIHIRLDAAEKNQSRVAWLVLTAVALAVLKTVIIEG